MLIARDVERTYAGTTPALRGVSFSVDDGELVALTGPSGCGKSTLLHLLGLLDAPDGGSIEIDGVDTATLDADARSDIRRARLGFIFQSFHLLPGASALENVELPLLYRGVAAEERRRRAKAALARVGLSDRENNTPGQLSGGQQQRVAIARALVAEPSILLADEPTGNLDSATTTEIIALLRELHAGGLTIVMVTHDPEIAANADRCVRLKDGKIVDDERRRPPPAAPGAIAPHDSSSFVGVIAMAMQTALRSLGRTKLRSALTLLGITIGIAAVVTTTALGAGAKERIEKTLRTLGTNMIMVSPGQPPDPESRRIRLEDKDIDAIRSDVFGIAALAPTVGSQVSVIYDNRSVQTRATGTTLDYFVARAWPVARGTLWATEDEERGARVCVIGATVAGALFGDDSPLGATIRVGRMPCEVVGVLDVKGQSAFGQDQDDVVVLPLNTMRMRIAGRGGSFIDNLVLSVADEQDMARVQARVTELLVERHRAKSEEAVRVRNLAELLGALDAQRAAISMLLLAIATISLLVGGIGVMNIMLVSVTERTREIGMRLAIGARRGDVRLQFLVESMVLTLVGGVSGLALGALASTLVGKFTDYAAIMQPQSALVAFAVSGVVGIVFGILPAERAARLVPSAALRHE